MLSYGYACNINIYVESLCFPCKLKYKGCSNFVTSVRLLAARSGEGIARGVVKFLVSLSDYH